MIIHNKRLCTFYVYHISHTLVRTRAIRDGILPKNWITTQQYHVISTGLLLHHQLEVWIVCLQSFIDSSILITITLGFLQANQISLAVNDIVDNGVGLRIGLFPRIKHIDIVRQDFYSTMRLILWKIKRAIDSDRGKTKDKAQYGKPYCTQSHKCPKDKESEVKRKEYRISQS